GGGSAPPPGVPRRGLAGETWFPPRERAEGERRSPAPLRHEAVLEPELVEAARDDEVDELADRLPPVVEAGREEEDDGARLPQLEHPPQVDRRQRRLAGHE